MKKLALIFAAIMLISLASVFCVSADSTAVWDGTAATKFAGGNGSEGNPYQISNAAEWAYFSVYAPANPGKFYKLTANITFNEGDATTWGTSFSGVDMTPYIVGSWYTPEGDPTPGKAGVANAPFVGTFDGDGHTISGFYAKKAKDAGDTVALFGSTAYGATATIKNLFITNSYFEAGDGVAAACVGQAEGGTTNLKNIYVDASVTIVSGSSYAGGVMAHLGQGKFSLPSVVIDGCVNAATVKAIDAKNSKCTSFGGILGNANQKVANITNCLNMGDISGYRYVGGIVGYGKVDDTKNPDSSVTIQYCVNTGKISTAYSNADNGKACSIVCFDGTVRDEQTAEYCYYVAGTASFGVYEKGEGEGATAVSVFDLCGAALLSDLDSDEWVARGNNGVSPKTYEICIPKGVANFAPAKTKYYTVYNVPAWLANYKTQTVFEIDTVAKFKELANFVNGAYVESGNFEGKTVKLTADLIFNEGDASAWGENAPENDMTAYIIGSWSAPFCGTFDGNKKTISGFYAAKKTAAEGDTVAIIGSTANGKTATIQNLIITNSYFESKSGAVAACVAQTKGGETTIKNVYVTESVTVVSGREFAGGIIAHVGQGNFEIPTLVVDSCVNEATVRADKESNGDVNNVGGILGNANQKNVYISNCLNIGEISGYRYVGGIIGRADGRSDDGNTIQIKNCINVGIIKAAYQSSANLGKACAIACFGDANRKNLTAENCFYLFGTGIFGVYKNKTELEGTMSAKSGSEFMGLNVAGLIYKKLADWSLRDGTIMIPTALLDFAPASDYAGGEVETEPAPETDPTPETDKQPETDKPETKKPVETTAPSESGSSGGCGGFTTVAAAILVAMAGLSTAIVIKKK